jgi:hypothetical protein
VDSALSRRNDLNFSGTSVVADVLYRNIGVSTTSSMFKDQKHFLDSNRSF